MPTVPKRWPTAYRLLLPSSSSSPSSLSLFCCSRRLRLSPPSVHLRKFNVSTSRSYKSLHLSEKPPFHFHSFSVPATMTQRRQYSSKADDKKPASSSDSAHHSSDDDHGHSHSHSHSIFGHSHSHEGHGGAENIIAALEGKGSSPAFPIVAPSLNSAYRQATEGAG